MIKAILLDLGGVLTINSNDYLGPKGNLIVDSGKWRDAGLGLIDDEEVFIEIAKSYSVNASDVKSWLFSKRELNDEVINVIRKLKPGLKKAIVSNSLKSIFYNFIEKYNLKSLFDLMVVSAEEGLKKPDQKIYLIACERLGVMPSECLFIDNDVEHIDAAKRLGMTGYLFSDARAFKAYLQTLEIIN